MRRPLVFVVVFHLLTSAVVLGQASSNRGLSTLSSVENAGGNMPVPALVKFSGSLRDLDGGILVGPKGLTFAIYKDETGASPFWLETQSIVLDSQGHFTVLLGATSPHGLPLDLFESGEAIWIGITPDDGVERPRLLLASVPYALKAAEAATLGGKTAQSFVTVDELQSLLQNGAASSTNILLPRPYPRGWPVSAQAPTFEATSPLGPSFISDALTGPPIRVISSDLIPHLNVEFLQGLHASEFAQLNTGNLFSTPQQFSGGVSLLPSPLPKNAVPHSSAPLDFTAISLDGTGALHNHRFRWWAEPTVASSGVAPALLNLLYASDNNLPVETGFGFNPDGTINFAAGQTFPSAAIFQAVNGGSIGTTSTDPTVQPVVYSSLYSWQQTPTAGAIKVGSSVVTLSPCPHGVNGSDSWHFMYLSGTGSPEVVLITGGTCISGAKSGTLEFQASGAHPVGYAIGTATAGLQEAIIDAVVPGSSFSSIPRPVVINPGEYLLRARLSVRASNMSVTSFGAILDCSMSDTCVMLGDPSNTDMFTRTTVKGLSFRPGVINGTYSAIEDNSNGSEISVVTQVRGTTGKETFGHLIQVDNDQSAKLDRINTNGQAALRCDAAFCGSAIYAPGPFAINAAVGYITNSALNLQCRGNGVDWQSGNTVDITDSVIEGYPQYGVRAGLSSGGYGNVQLNNVYEEVGGCVNPAGNIGEAGVIMNGGPVFWSGGQGPAGIMPQFSNSGTNRWYYFVVPHSSLGPGNALYAGWAQTDNVTPVTVTTADIPGATTFDLLKVSPPTVEGELPHAPNGTMVPPAEGAVIVGLSRASACSNGICTFTDATNAMPGPYTVPPPTYFPLLMFWPGSVVLGSITDSNSIESPASLNVSVNFNLGQSMTVNSVMGVNGPSIYATMCPGLALGSPIWVSCTADSLPPNTVYQQEALLLPNQPSNGGAPASANLKGRVNFVNAGAQPGHIITLVDSNVNKTIATAHNRPHNDPSDSYIGIDQFYGANVGLSVGASLSISHYIGNSGDGKSWLERLSAGAKIFNVPVTINGDLTINGTCTGCAGTTPQLTSMTNTSAMQPGLRGESKLGFNNGRLSVSEVAGPVREVAKKLPEQFTYTLVSADGTLSPGTTTRSVYVNRAATFHISEVYCESDSGHALINLRSQNSSILLSDLACSAEGTYSSAFSPGKDEVVLGAKIDHVTVDGNNLRRLNVVVKYLPD